MKRISTIIIAMALLLGMAQCKKQETPANAGKPVHITLNVGDNGSRHIVDPSNGSVAPSDGDIIYVGHDGKFVGTLERTNGIFSGTIYPNENVTGQKLHFYFLGGKTPATAPTAGTTESFTISIDDQTDKLPVLSYAASDQVYIDGNTEYSAELVNQCALAKFTLTTGTNENVSVSGLKNEATVNFATPGITATDEYGFITLNSGNENEANTVRYAILLPQDGLTADVIIGEIGGTGASSYNVDVPNIEAHRYYGKDGDLVIDNGTPAPAVPEGAINGLFSVSATQQVYFSQGNLQYIGSAATPYWKFAEHQWDYLGTTTGQNSSNQNVDRDLFGWGTSGWDCGNTYYRPWDSNDSDGGLYGPSGQYNLTGSYAHSDWGVHNAISNGGNAEGQWRTLTQSEWDYVFNSRSTTSGIRYAKAQVAGVNGVILLPDDWSASYYSLSNTNQSEAGFTSNVIGSADWTNSLQSRGAVFLPAAGGREGTSVSNAVVGIYWSASYSYYSYGAYAVYFNDGYLYTDTWGSRSKGQSVRLVCPAE